MAASLSPSCLFISSVRAAHPGLAPVVLCLCVGFMQALTWTPRVPGGRRDLLRSVEMCGGGGGAVPVGQASLDPRLTRCWPGQRRGRRGRDVDCPRGGAVGLRVRVGVIYRVWLRRRERVGVVWLLRRRREGVSVRVAALYRGLLVGRRFVSGIIVLVVEAAVPFQRPPDLVSPADRRVVTLARGAVVGHRNASQRDTLPLGGFGGEAPRTLRSGGRHGHGLAHHRGVRDVGAGRGRGLRQLSSPPPWRARARGGRDGAPAD